MNNLQECPICKSKTFACNSWSEIGWGTVEVHGHCKRCGYIIEKCYSPTCEGFIDVKKGYRNAVGEYIPKDVKRHKRIRRKNNIKGMEINEAWMYV